jgi:hypothetical protein
MHDDALLIHRGWCVRGGAMRRAAGGPDAVLLL